MRTVWGQALGFHEKDSSENVGYFLELAKNNQVPASFPRTVFSVPAHAEDAGGLANTPGDPAPELFVQTNVIQL